MKTKVGKCKVAKTKGGAQVFFFPDENHKIEALEQMGMTESIYVQQNYGGHQDDTADISWADDADSSSSIMLITVEKSDPL